MMFGCLLYRSPSVLPTHIDFLVFVRGRCFGACSVIARRASSRWFVTLSEVTLVLE
jgi:hypothetical protein